MDGRAGLSPPHTSRKVTLLEIEVATLGIPLILSCFVHTPSRFLKDSLSARRWPLFVSLILIGSYASIASTQTVVNPGGLLSGVGTIHGNLVNSGIVSPGDPVGILAVSGNYTQNANGTLRIEAGGSALGQYGILAVAGHASIAGTLQIVPLNGFQLQIGEKLTFLGAAGGISGNFSTIKNPFISNTIVEAELVVTPNIIEIVGTQGSFSSTPGIATTPNQLAVAKALDSAAGDPREAALFAFLNSQPLSALPHDLNLIAPTQISSMNATTVSLGRVQASNVGQRLNYIRAGGPSGFSSSGFGITGGAASFDEGFAGVSGPEGKAVPPVFAPTPENRWGVFVTGTGEFTNVDSTPNAAGYNVDTGGITLGVDYRLTPNFVIGLDGGYAHTNVSLDGGGHIDINAGTIGLYATVFGNGFYLNTAVSGGPSGYDTERTGLQGNASGSTNGGNIDFLISGGYDWTRGNLSIGPTATFQFSYVGLDGFTETGSLAPLKFRDQNYESERTIFGAKASYNWKIGNITLIPQVSAGWVHEYGSVAYAVVANFATGAGNSFTVNGPEIGRDGVLVTAGMSMVWTNRISTYIYYDGELARTNYDSHTVTGGIRISF
jgi:outer membrane autotransporter protein